MHTKLQSLQNNLKNRVYIAGISAQNLKYLDIDELKFEWVTENRDEYIFLIINDLKLGKIKLKVLVMSIIAISISCNKKEVTGVNIGYKDPLTSRAADLGIAPSQAMKHVIEEYNSSKNESQPKINLFIQDGRWEKDAVLPAYKKLRKEHDIDVLLISNSDGILDIQDRTLKDGVIAVNPLDNNRSLSSLNRNTFKIAKFTEEAHRILGVRIIELGLKKALILLFQNDFMNNQGICGNISIT